MPQIWIKPETTETDINNLPANYVVIQVVSIGINTGKEVYIQYALFYGAIK